MIETKEMKEEDEEVKNRSNNNQTTTPRSSSSTPSSTTDESKYEVQDLRDRLKSTRGSMFNLIEKELGLKIGWRKLSRQADLFHESVIIDPDNRIS
ncbi:hypothetical protein TSUD_246940 [Trifolium subterraneum]|uniref:Uncharacterized protein n=1 Tax=Trifolium subterraneum TaxID=3900 RepID=A0A2Z6NF01_TRISU|nr:hypothetical protein TSUD_246940 [Trifolium subterraneum]